MRSRKTPPIFFDLDETLIFADEDNALHAKARKMELNHLSVFD